MRTELFELARPVTPSDHSLGPANANVTLVEYGDFECPNCKQAASVVKLLLAESPHQIRFVYRHFPQEEVHPHSRRAAEAAECSGAQGKFWPMHDLLFEHQHKLELHHLHAYGQRLDLDMVRFDAEMIDTVYLQRIREHQASGIGSGVRATPTFFINGELLDVSFGIATLFEAVRREI